MSKVPSDIDDPDRPSEVVGALSLGDFKGLRRVAVVTRTPRSILILMFCLAALFVAAWWVKQLDGALTLGITVGSLVGPIFDVFGSVAIVLMPAALLWRVPSAFRTRTALFSGLAVLAAHEFLVTAGLYSSIDFETSSALTVLQSSLPFLAPAGAALVAYGLLQLRIERPRIGFLLVGIIAIYVLLAVLPTVIIVLRGALGPDDLRGDGISWWAILFAVTTAFAVWIAVDAWIRQEPPTMFWVLLAAALPLRVLAAVWQVPQNVAMVVYQTSLPDAVAALASATSVVPILLAFIAYLRYAPLSPAEAPLPPAEAPLPPAVPAEPADPLPPAEPADVADESESTGDPSHAARG